MSFTRIVVQRQLEDNRIETNRFDESMDKVITTFEVEYGTESSCNDFHV